MLLGDRAPSTTCSAQGPRSKVTGSPGALPSLCPAGHHESAAQSGQSSFPPGLPQDLETSQRERPGPLQPQSPVPFTPGADQAIPLPLPGAPRWLLPPRGGPGVWQVSPGGASQFCSRPLPLTTGLGPTWSPRVLQDLRPSSRPNQAPGDPTPRGSATPKTQNKGTNVPDPCPDQDPSSPERQWAEGASSSGCVPRAEARVPSPHQYEREERSLPHPPQGAPLSQAASLITERRGGPARGPEAELAPCIPQLGSWALCVDGRTAVMPCPRSEPISLGADPDTPRLPGTGRRCAVCGCLSDWRPERPGQCRARWGLTRGAMHRLSHPVQAAGHRDLGDKQPERENPLYCETLVQALDVETSARWEVAPTHATPPLTERPHDGGPHPNTS